MIAPCAAHVPIGRPPAFVAIWRHGREVAAKPLPHHPRQPLFLQRGDVIRVVRPGSFTFKLAGNTVRLRHALVRLVCSDSALVVSVRSGLTYVRTASASGAAGIVVTPELTAYATAGKTTFDVDRNPYTAASRAWTFDEPIAVARTSDPSLKLNARITYTAISDPSGLRLDVWPFSLSAAQRAPAPADGLVPFWADGLECSVDCPAPGAIPGWPLKPFNQQHAIRSALNELRPANFHLALDIEARDFQPVYPISSGYVQVIQASGPDERVRVGNFIYWHIDRTVGSGTYASAYQTELGTVKYNFKHLAFSEIGPAGQFLNPLRPGGRMLSPWSDTEAPVIGIPAVYADGRATVAAFDPQSLVEPSSYETPVLAPAALAWRLFDASGHPLTPLEWALRGSQNYPPGLRPVVFAPGASNPGFNCFAFRVLCIPNWTYWLAGGLTDSLPITALAPGRYRLSVYAWDWAGNTSALDEWLTLPLTGAPPAPSGPLLPHAADR